MQIATQATQRSESDEFGNLFEAGKHFMNQLMNEGRSEIVPGTAVKLTNAGQQRLEQTLVHLTPLSIASLPVPATLIPMAQ